MYEIKERNEDKNIVTVSDNSKLILQGFFVLLILCGGFGFLLGHYIFPETCKDCQVITEEVRSEGNAYIDFVSGTEYILGSGAFDTGQVIIRVTDYKGNPLNASCMGSILNPDKTFYVYLQSMTSSTINGNYYMSFSIPSSNTGIFEDYVNCSVTLGSQTVKVSKSSSFHVAPFDTYFNNISQQIISVNGTCLSVNQTVINAEQNIINQINNSTFNITADLTQIINDMSTYYSNLVMIENNQTSVITGAITSAKTEILNSIKATRSDIEIIKEWLSYMLGFVSDRPLEEGQNWIDKIVGRKVNLPDWIIPRPQ
jgi:hypothetical protein